MPTPIFLLMPEWQGSPSSRAMQLAEGAASLREDLPASRTLEVPVPLEAGDAMGTPVARLSSLLRARDAARTLLTEATEAEADTVPITLGGDCASSLAGLEAAVRAHGDGLAVLWLDAHADLQHPSTSPSGAASGMALRHALGDGSPDLAFTTPVTPENVVLVGTRATDPEEIAEITARNIVVINDASDTGADEFGQRVADRLTASHATAVYVHIDLDVLDPAEFTAVHDAVPFGLTTAQLIAAVRAAVAALPLAGAAICEFAPADAMTAADDQPTVLRALAALTSGGAR